MTGRLDPSTSGAPALPQGNGPESGYARTSAFQTANVTAGIARGAVVISANDDAESPLRIFGPGSNFADHRLLEVTAGGELDHCGQHVHRLPARRIDGRARSGQTLDPFARSGRYRTASL